MYGFPPPLKGEDIFAVSKKSTPSKKRNAVINAHTQVYGIIGHPVRHSFSPALHNAAFQACGLNAVYVAFDVENIENAIRGIRAALCLDEYSAEYSRRHNDANVMVLGGRRTSPEEAEKLVDIWLSTAFEGGRHIRRIEKIHTIEKEECRD
ncbi:MAG: ribose-5-phosphate isomerase [Brevinematales bacterium]|nr:ribose-5-phosphate isomerase [Brevinematales bacterium]